MTTAATVMPVPALDRPQILYALTVDQYHEMIDLGILPEGEPFELISGQVVRKNRSAVGENPMTVGTHHAWAVKKLAKLGRRFEKLGCHLQTQQPVAIPPFNEPELDGAVVEGTEDNYLDRKPSPTDVLCIIEVSDASLQYDRTIKQQIYADAGIAQYVLVNLVDKCIEVYTQPLVGKGRYGQSETLLPRQQVKFLAPRGKELALSVKQLIP